MEIIYSQPTDVAEQAKEDIWERLCLEAEAEARKASTSGQPLKQEAK